jgi:uncharacterized protein (TIGR03435 family)
LPEASAIKGTQEGFEFRGVQMERFSTFLTGLSDRPVADRTGMTGAYDFNIHLEVNDPDPGRGGGVRAAALDWSRSSMFSDLPRQLGLKLEAGEGPVEYLVVDHIEQPAVN